MTFSKDDILENVNSEASDNLRYCEIKEVIPDDGVYLVKYNGLENLRLLCENGAIRNFRKVNF